MALTQISTGGVKDDAVTAGKIPANAIGSSEIADDAVGTAQIADDGVEQAAVADEAIDEARLQISNSGTNGQFLSKQSGNTGGLTWATVTVPDSDKIEEGNTSIETVDTGSDGHVKITTEGTERVRVIADGKVGIGTNAPTEWLHVKGSNASIQTEEAGGGILKLKSSGSSGNIGTESNHPLLLNANGGEKFRVGTSGQLGVAGANYGSSGQVLTSQGASSAPQWASPSGGLSVVDQWQYASSGQYLADSGNTLWLGEGTANAWNTGSERSSGTFTRTPNAGFPIGSGISNTADSSSGNDRYGWFKFPATGVYRVDMNLQLHRYSWSNKYVTYRTAFSTNGGTSFSNISEGVLRLENTYTRQMLAYATSFVNVTDTSDDIVKFWLETDQTSNLPSSPIGVVQVKALSNVTFMKVN